MADDFMTNDPVVRVEDGTWCRIVDVDGLGLRRPLSFKREVTWTREAGAHAVLVNGTGREIDSSSSFCDAGGYLTCLGSAFEAAMDLVAENGIGDGPFAVEVMLEVRDRPGIALPAEPWDTASTPRRYRRVPRDWIAHGDVAAVERWMALPEAARFGDPSPVMRLDSMPPVFLGSVWTTRGGRHDDFSVARGAVLTALAGLPDKFSDEVRNRVSRYLRAHAQA